MSVPLEIVDLLFFCIQQFGILLGVGGEVVVLVSYLLAIRDHTIDAAEVGSFRKVRGAVNLGLGCIAISGLGITAIHGISAQMDILAQPAYISKWLLVCMIFGLAFYTKRLELSKGIAEGVVGAIWLAMLVLHITAPIITWGLLGALFGAWILVFMTIWVGVVYAIGGKEALWTPRVPSAVQQEEPETPTEPTPSHTPILATLAPSPRPSTPATPPPTLPIAKIQPYVPVAPPPPKNTEVAAPQKERPKQIQSLSELSLQDEEFPYKKTVIDRTEVLHPHLTGEGEAAKVLPPPPPPPSTDVTPSSQPTKESDTTSLPAHVQR